MADRKIAGETFDTMRGTVQPAAESLEELTRPGQDHEIVRLPGERAPFTMLRTVKIVADEATAKTLIDTYRGMKATSVTIYDAGGNQYDDCMIYEVTVSKRAVIHAGSQKVWVTARWQIKPLS